MQRLTSLLHLALIASLTTGCTTLSFPASPILIVTPPSPANIQAGQSAQFSVVAQSDTTLQYQWYRGGSAIAGATATTLLIQNAALSQSGSEFSVEVHNATTTASTTPVPLTVTPLDPHLSITSLQNMPFSTGAIPLTASTLSPAPVVYSVTSGPAQISGSQVTLTGIGLVTVTASQTASGNFAAATASASFSVAMNVMVSPISPATTTMGPGSILFSAQAMGGPTNQLHWSSTAGTWSSSTWTSPNTAGSYTIQAQSVDDPTKSSNATVVISAPVIYQQPTLAEACPTGDVTLAVGANYATSYQWSMNGTPIAGATAASYTAGSLSPSYTNAAYSVTASNAAGNVVSAAVTVPPISVIAQQPANASTAVTEHATFAVQANGHSPFTYQWFALQQSGSTPIAIPGATQSSYSTPALAMNQNGWQVYAVVTDACGRQLTSNNATLQVTGISGPPEIDQQPQSLSTTPGGPAAFSVHATGTAPLTYQWFLIPAGTTGPGQAISNATQPTLTLQPSDTALADDQNQFYATASNSSGTAASASATLAIGAGISIQKQPQTQFANAGDAVSFSVVATSSLPITYQWYAAPPNSTSFQPIAGATSATYTIAATAASEDGTAYYVVLNNGVTASVQSSTALLFLNRESTDLGCPWQTSGSAIAQGACSFQLTDATINEAGRAVIPFVVPTDGLIVSFTAAIDETSDPPADGFAFVLGDPTLGATPSSQGLVGGGLGALGIPGLAVTFDDFFNGPQPGSIHHFADPPVPYVGVTRSESDLFEAPYLIEDSAIQPLAAPGQLITHQFQIACVDGSIQVTMDGLQILNENVNMPASAYLFLTASTGLDFERLVISNVTVSARTQ